MKNPLLDKDFLRSLDQEKEREIYARVISLNFDEEPIEEITGKVTSGSINIDGKSAVRRTCSLTLVAKEMNIHDYYWGMNTKFFLEIGMKNNINPEYDDIIWFPQGLYLISTFNTSQSVNNYTISLQGKDKMVLLNGEIGGIITALTHDFGTVDVQQPDGSIMNEKIPIKKIIQSAVHTFAKEPMRNIIINDVDDYGVELMEYRGNEPLYLLVDRITQEVSNIRIGKKGAEEYLPRQYLFKHHGESEWKRNSDRQLLYISLDENTRPAKEKITDIVYDNRVDYLDIPNNPTILGVPVNNNNIQEYYVIKVETGTTIGYRMTDLTFAGDLILKAGDSVSQMLDKIVDMLGEFEYFYDLEGHFVFQKKKTYIQTSWNNIVQNEDSETYVDNLTESSAITYNFENANLVTAFTNNPDLKNLKNDFSIWGARISATGAEIPIHLRYAIDKKPLFYQNYKGDVWASMVKTREQIETEVRQEIMDSVELYEKTPNPNGLSEDWWEIMDWAEYYRRLTGELPSGSIGNYCQGYVKKEDIDLNSLFPPSKYMNGGYEGTWTPIDIYIFDIAYEDGEMRLGYFGHGTGCGHKYSYFLNRAETGQGTSFIYKPEIPEAEATEKFEENVKTKVDYLVTRYSHEWREIIYQMALDYMEHHDEDDFLLKVAKNNTDAITQESYYPTGITGYEQYYTDILGFWRQLYNPDYIHTFNKVEITASQFDNKIHWTPVQCPYNLKFDSAYQFLVKNEHKDFSFVSFTEKGWENVVDKTQYYYLKKVANYFAENVYYIEIKDEYMKDDDNKNYWSYIALEKPELLNFWFDFLDTADGTMERCSAHNIGDRPKAENDNNVKSIYYRDTPNIIVINPIALKKEARMKILKAYSTEKDWEQAIIDEYGTEIDVERQKEVMINTMMDMKIAEIKTLNPGYTLIRLNPASENLFNISAQGKSTFDVLNNYLYNYSHCADTITINALPVYYLQPNTRVSVKDDNSGINGEYIINKITLPLQHSGLMSISATKAVERLY